MLIIRKSYNVENAAVSTINTFFVVLVLFLGYWCS